MQSNTTVYVAPTATAATAVLLSNTTSQTAPGEYTFVQPKRGCCDSQRVVMTVNVCDGQVTHHVTSGTACSTTCQDRFLRESDVNSIVSVNTYMLSQAGRITRIVLGFLFFSSMFSTGVYMLCASGNGVSDSAPTAADAVADTARRMLSYSSYSSYHSYSYAYGGPSMDPSFGVPVGSVVLAISVLLLLSAVAAWFACCLRLHQLTLILKSGGLAHQGTMSIWLSPDQVTELAAVIKAARAAHHHTRLGADRDSIVATAQAASQELRNRRAYVPAPAPIATSYPQQQQQPMATVTGQQLQNPVTAQYQPPHQQ